LTSWFQGLLGPLPISCRGDALNAIFVLFDLGTKEEVVINMVGGFIELGAEAFQTPSAHRYGLGLIVLGVGFPEFRVDRSGCRVS
jgi:hypothetical protein